ncbi:hypothetical protein A6A08_21360 [Nocardiopsis sp. TSRI0078]|nr:hypothetical protein A6A08_21360 [Nocardiopsis sp. TSRI0078]
MHHQGPGQGFLVLPVRALGHSCTQLVGGEQPRVREPGDLALHRFREQLLEEALPFGDGRRVEGSDAHPFDLSNVEVEYDVGVLAQAADRGLTAMG